MAPPANQATTSPTSDLQEPQPLPARVAFITAVTVLQPPATAWPMAALVTPLQLQTWLSAGISSSVTAWGGAPRSNISDSRSSGSGLSRSKACIRKAALEMSPIRMPPTRRPSRTISFL